jgi:hypothetical protein
MIDNPFVEAIEREEDDARYNRIRQEINALIYDRVALYGLWRLYPWWSLNRYHFRASKPWQLKHLEMEALAACESPFDELPEIVRDGAWLGSVKDLFFVWRYEDKQTSTMRR